MRKIVIVVFAVALAGGLGAAPSPKALAHLEKLGGLVEVPRGGKRVVIADAQSKVPSTNIAETVKGMRTATMLPVERETVAASSEFPGVRAKSMIGDKVGAVLFVVDMADLPALLVAPEEMWAAVNIRPLGADGASADVVAARTNKELWRAFAMVFGASNSMYQPCLMRSMTTLKDLDSVNLKAFCPEPIQKIRMTAKALDIRTFHRGTYRSACLAGWAPLPTNDTQRAIWEETHKAPEQPVTIEYDAKKGK